jgi:DUF2891 family protein
MQNLPTLTAAQAVRFATIALDNLGRDYPHRLDHVLGGPADAVPPQRLHPAFHGSFDWHSCVHMHWLLARVRRRFPASPVQAAIDALFDRHFTHDTIAGELAYLARPDSASFERPYGWAWLLKLATELRTGADAERRGAGTPVREPLATPVREPLAAPMRDAQPRVAGIDAWAHAIDPLAVAFAARFCEFLPRARYPVRHGVHPNSAFALGFAVDYARAAGDRDLEDACTAKALDWYGHDRDAPAAWEPCGADFLSPALVEASLMHRVLAPPVFADWLAAFLPGFAAAQPGALFVPVAVDDRADPQLVHLDGLNLSRAWCLRGIAARLPADDARRAVCDRAAAAHLEAGLRGLDSDAFVGTHWLASFALLALDDREPVLK